jgi:hypothetical protein
MAVASADDAKVRHPMDLSVLITHLGNLDHRLARVEQILPTLATKEELRAAIEPLATKAELSELRQTVCEEGERSRGHMDVLIEGQREDIQLLAEHLTVVMTRLDGR